MANTIGKIENYSQAESPIAIQRKWFSFGIRKEALMITMMSETTMGSGI
ncbi:MAG: hypothetical protein U9R53_01670 [Chloroflexota bacterium]|nr:hypothetical protein [Chloroflexota bacterium]